jgi:hypothetical protein
MSFTDQKRRIAVESDLKARWGGHPAGERFRCYMCGHKFRLGDGWRWVYAGGRTFEVEGKKSGLYNFMVCDSCDGDDVLDRWVKMNEEYHTKFWWAIREGCGYENN